MAKPKILLLGAGGQVGMALRSSLKSLGEVAPITRVQVDLAELDAVAALLEKEKPQIIVNAAAFTAVDAAESQIENARRLNAELPQRLARYCFDNDAMLVDYSTDYVFDGTKVGAWSEENPVAPVNTYGLTKLEGLRAIESSGCDYLVFRVTWVYSVEGKNFPNTIRRLAGEKDEIRVVDDQVGAPTPAWWIAEITVKALAQVLTDRAKCGLYNLAPTGSVSWCGFAREIVSDLEKLDQNIKLTAKNVLPVPSSDYPTPAKRPGNSRLDTSKLQSVFGIIPDSWQNLYKRTFHEGAKAKA